jgi:hypothetical protein
LPGELTGISVVASGFFAFRSTAPFVLPKYPDATDFSDVTLDYDARIRLC